MSRTVARGGSMGLQAVEAWAFRPMKRDLTNRALALAFDCRETRIRAWVYSPKGPFP